VFSKYFLFGVFLMFLITAGIFDGCKDNGTSPYGGNSGGGGGNVPANQVWMQGMSFNPGTRTISIGTKITWVNKDSYAHTVISGTPGSPDGTFDSGNMAGGASFSYTFNTAGTFKFYCRIHNMRGTITVQ
jgi:plastocyanin